MYMYCGRSFTCEVSLHDSSLGCSVVMCTQKLGGVPGCVIVTLWPLQQPAMNVGW